MVINRQTKACILFTLAWLTATVFGCGTLKSHPGLTIVPISSFNQLAGEWKGLSKRLPDMRDDAWVLLMIREDGFFKFAGNRETDIVLGIGTLTIRDGTVVAAGAKGSGTLTLHDNGGDSVLVIQATLKDGRHLYMEMTRVR